MNRNSLKDLILIIFLLHLENIRGHLPFDSKWQLLPDSEIIDQQTFISFAPLKSDFFTLGFNCIDPDFTFNEAKENGKIILSFDKSQDNKTLRVMGKLYLIESKNNSQEITHSVLPIKKEDCFEVNYIINKKGEYKLKIFGNKGNKEEYNELCTLKLTSERDSKNPREFPSTTALYLNSDIQIIQPYNEILKEGEKITFEMKSTTFEQLYIGVNTGEMTNFTEMSKEENIFIEEDFLIIF